MTTVNLTLLLAFSMKKAGFSDKKSEGGKKGGKKGKAKDAEATPKEAEKKDKKQKGKKNILKKEVKKEESVVKPKNLFEVGSPKKFAHIEYELIPEKPPFKIDINCWGNFAKVISLLIHFISLIIPNFARFIVRTTCGH